MRMDAATAAPAMKKGRRRR